MKPGLYTAHTGEEIYGLLSAMVAAGDARFVGERYDELGNKHLAVEVLPKGRRARANPPGTIRMGPEFFTAAIKDYEDWQEKWWREAIQNAVDAGADIVRCEVDRVDDGAHSYNVISCEDNGHGMDEYTLVEKFLVLGATSKTSGTTTGGFGKAKELLLLPWMLWRVESRGLIVEGQGAEYELTYTSRERRGTKLTVHMPDDRTTHEPAAIAFITKCHLPRVTFYVNRKEVRANLRKGELVKQLDDKAAIHYDKRESDYDRMLIRANGLYMFNQYVYSEVPGTIVVELMKPSIELLTANRDGFRDFSLRREMQNFADRLATDATTELKSKKGLIRKKFSGSGKFEALRPERTEAALLEMLGPMMPRGGSGRDRGLKLSKAQEKELEGVMKMLSSTSQPEQDFSEWGDGGTGEQPAPDLDMRVTADLANAMLDGTTVRGPDHLEAIAKQLAWEPDFYLYNNIEGWRVPRKFYPEKMAPTIRKLLRFWAELCRFALIGLNSQARFGVGFVFEEDVHGMHEADTDGHWLMINPFVDTLPSGSMYSLANKSHVDKIWSTCVHEVTHMADRIDYHGDSYASALTRNFGLLRRTTAQVEKIRKQVVGRKKSKKKPKLPVVAKQFEILREISAADAISEHATLEYLKAVTGFDEGSSPATGWDLNALEAKGWIDSAWDEKFGMFKFALTDAGFNRYVELTKKRERKAS